MKEKISVVVCARNEESRIEGALKSIVLNNPDEIIVVDGNSTDRTVEIAAKYATRVIVSPRRGISWDRQIGIDATRNDLIAMIDADHVLRPDDIESLRRDMEKYGFSMVQSQLIAYHNNGFWNAAEEQMWEVTHNTPGPRRMIGTAPAIFRKEIFEKVRFDGTITERIDDTDFIYRLSQHPEFTYGIGDTRIRQLHEGDFKTYMRKFLWYGDGDAEFVRKHPERAASMLFHLLVRYPFMHSGHAIRRGYGKVVPFFVLQGVVRFAGLVRHFFRRASPSGAQL